MHDTPLGVEARPESISPWSPGNHIAGVVDHEAGDLRSIGRVPRHVADGRRFRASGVEHHSNVLGSGLSPLSSLSPLCLTLPRSSSSCGRTKIVLTVRLLGNNPPEKTRSANVNVPSVPTMNDVMT